MKVTLRRREEERSQPTMENNSLDLVHGAAIYEQDNFSLDSNMTSEEFLKLVLGPQRQDDKVEILCRI